MRFHADWRREFWGDIFPTREGDVNLVHPAKGVFIGWHRHQRQDDGLFVIKGALRVRAFRTVPRVDGIEWVLTDMLKDQLPILIIRNTWHGYEALTDDTLVLQFNGPGKWDGTDEERQSLDEIPWNLPTP